MPKCPCQRCSRRALRCSLIIVLDSAPINHRAERIVAARAIVSALLMAALVMALTLDDFVVVGWALFLAYIVVAIYPCIVSPHKNALNGVLVGGGVCLT